MTPVLEKLFGGGQAPNTGQHTPVRHISANETATVSPGDVFCEMRGADPTPKSEKIARTFDFIGRRNETMRAQLDSIEYSFRDVEAIRTQFYDALASVAETLEEIERRKVAQLEAERKLEKLTAAHERLKMDKAELRVERDALAVVQGEQSARIADFERMMTTGEAASSEARARLTEQSARLEHAERELEDNRRTQHALSEKLQATCAELVNKEDRLQEVERQCGSLNDHCGLLAQENDGLRTKIEEFAILASKRSRELSELKDERDERKRHLREVETSLGRETAAHAKLKAAHLDAVEAQRLNEANLQEKLAATTTRLEAAQQLLLEARAEMHEQDEAVRDFEQRALEHSLAEKALEALIADLEKDVSSAHAVLAEAEVARTVATEQSVAVAGALKDKEVALRRAEDKIVTLEASFEKGAKATLAARSLFEEEITRLKERLEAESTARLIAGGALQAYERRAMPGGR